MKSCMAIFISAIVLLSFGLFFACGDSTGPDDQHIFPDPIDSVAQDISLNIYSVFSGSLLEINFLNTEGQAVIDVADTGVAIGIGLNIYAYAEGFYSKVYTCDNGDTLDIDLDAVPDVPNSITGVIYEASSMSSFCYCADQAISIIRTDGYGFVTTTDSLGRYGAKDMPPGTYAIAVPLEDTVIIFQAVITSNADYRDFNYAHEVYLRAPYIYLYPERQTDITVNLQFLQGGGVTESDPPYNDGWQVNVTPDGTIDDRYDYLFYEGKLPDLPAPQSGWLVSGDNLQANIAELLSSLGFNENETKDFTDYWVPVIEDSPYYAFFYLDPESLVGLNISPEPVNVLRVFFIISPLDRPISLPAPELQLLLSRDGFTAVEWGVIGWPDK